MFRLGTGAALFFEILTDGFFSGQPVSADLDAFDFTAPDELANEIGCETTDAGSLRDRNKVGGEVLQSRDVGGLLPYRIGPARIAGIILAFR